MHSAVQSKIRTACSRADRDELQAAQQRCSLTGETYHYDSVLVLHHRLQLRWHTLTALAMTPGQLRPRGLHLAYHSLLSLASVAIGCSRQRSRGTALYLCRHRLRQTAANCDGSPWLGPSSAHVLIALRLLPAAQACWLRLAVAVPAGHNRDAQLSILAAATRQMRAAPQ